MPVDELLIELLIKGACNVAGIAIKEGRKNAENKQQQREFLVSTLVKSLTCFQQGLEQLAEYLESKDTTPIPKSWRKEWRNLLKEATKACSVETYTHIPIVCYSLKEVISFLSEMKDEVEPGNPAFRNAKNAFKCSSLFASAIFQSTKIKNNLDYLLLYSFATAMKVNAAIMEHFMTSPELSVAVVIGYIEQLQLYGRGWVGKVANGLKKSLLLKCLDALFVLAVRLNQSFKQEVRVELNEELRLCQTSGLFSLVSHYGFITQTAFGKQGVNDEDFDGPTSIAVNSQGLVIVADSRNHKIKAMSANGKVEWLCEPISEDADGNVPFLIATNQHDEIFAVFWKESTRKTTIVKFDPNGRFMHSFETRYGDVRREVIPCGISVSSRGFLYLGDGGNGCIYVLEQDEATLSPRHIIRLRGIESHFLFCLGPNDDLIVVARKKLVIFYEDRRMPKNVELRWHQKFIEIKEWRPLGVAYDADLKRVLVVTAGQIKTQTYHLLNKTVHLKPTMWFLSDESYVLMRSVQLPLDDIDNTHGRFDLAAGRNGLWCVTEATHRVHCFTMMYHLIKP